MEPEESEETVEPEAHREPVEPEESEETVGLVEPVETEEEESWTFGYTIGTENNPISRRF